MVTEVVFVRGTEEEITCLFAQFRENKTRNHYFLKTGGENISLPELTLDFKGDCVINV